MKLRWIDSLKGIGIMLVVLGHSRPPHILSTYIYSFHMPLFFFISGYLFNFTKYAASTSGFLKGRIRSLVVPYLFFEGIACLFYFSVFSVYHHGNRNIGLYDKGIFSLLYDILYSVWPMIPVNDPLWFLTCLFMTEVLFYMLAKRYHEDQKKLIYSVIFVSIIGYLYSVYLPLRLPWSFDVALTAVAFYSAGYFLRNRYENMLFQPKSLFPKICIFIHLLFLGYLLKFPISRIDMCNLTYGNFFIFYLWTFTGIFTYWYVFKKIGSFKVLEYYGRNSLTVLGLHFIIIGVIQQLAALCPGAELSFFRNKAFLSLASTVLSLVCIVPIIYLFNQYFSLFLGKTHSSGYFETITAQFQSILKRLRL